jgi:hypothetical protein
MNTKPASITLSVCLGLFVMHAAQSAGTVDPGKLPTADQLQQWHVEKAGLGPTFSGGPAWQAHMQFVEAALRDRGVVDITKEPITYTRWFASDNPEAGERNLRIDDTEIPVAGYWAYSGSTGAGGVSAPLIYYERKMPVAALKNHIVVFDVGAVPASMGPMFKAGNEYETDDRNHDEQAIASDQWYQGNYITRFGKYDELLKDSGAAGARVIYDMSPGRARGLYTFPLLNAGVFGVPGIYVDRVVGEQVREAALAGRTASMTLVATEEETETYFFYGYLPGRHYGTDADELVLLVTHSEGPNLTQENGTLGIVGIVDYFAKVPQVDRDRTLVILFDPQHYMPGRHLVHWYEDHPDIMSKVVSSIGVEQLGQREYAEQGNEYGLNGLPEPTLFFAQDNDRLVELAIQAVKDNAIPRAEVRVPSRKKQGMWAGLGDVAIKYNMPGFALSSGMSGYWTTTPGVESFDKDLCFRQIGALVQLTDALMTADSETIAVPKVDPAKNPALSPGTPR